MRIHGESAGDVLTDQARDARAHGPDDDSGFKARMKKRAQSTVMGSMKRTFVRGARGSGKTI